MKVTTSAIAAVILAGAAMLTGCASEEEKLCKQAYGYMLDAAGNMRVAETEGDYVARCAQLPESAHVCLTRADMNSVNVGSRPSPGCSAEMYPKLKSSS